MGERGFYFFGGPLLLVFGVAWTVAAGKISEHQKEHGLAPGFMKQRMSPGLNRLAGIGLAAFGIAFLIVGLTR
jgi:hypothetical protein